MPPLPYPVNPLYPQPPFPGSPQYPNPRPYPIVIEPQPSRPVPNPGYMKPCLCGNSVVPTCQPIFPCGNNQNNNNNYYGSWNSWDSWNLNFLG
uniref:Uncharacterized protein n=1 Tax=Panagrolaimus davidi TaxID=227884 RepID=A0A914Q7E6_9BILA